MPIIPDTQETTVLRTHYADQATWEAVRQAMLAPSQKNDAAFYAELIKAAVRDIIGQSIEIPVEIPVEPFRAYLDFLDDPIYEGMTIDEITHNAGANRSFILVVDAFTISHPEHPILCIDLFDTPTQSFRFIPSETSSVENNLSIANMDFEDFLYVLPDDGIFRGF